MERKPGVCGRARIALSSKPVLPIFALFVSMVMLGCCIIALKTDYWMKNTTNYIDATILGTKYFELDVAIHVNPSTMWIQLTYQKTYEDQHTSSPELSIPFSEAGSFFGPIDADTAGQYNNVSDMVMWLMYVSTGVLGLLVLLVIVMCLQVIANKPVNRLHQRLYVFLSFASAILPTVSVTWWAVTVPNPADLAAVQASDAVSMTIDGDMGWSAVLAIVGGCAMLLTTLCLAIYIPPRPQAPLDAALNHDGDYVSPYHPLSLPQVIEDAEDGSVEGFTG